MFEKSFLYKLIHNLKSQKSNIDDVIIRFKKSEIEFTYANKIYINCMSTNFNQAYKTDFYFIVDRTKLLKFLYRVYNSSLETNLNTVNLNYTCHLDVRTKELVHHLYNQDYHINLYCNQMNDTQYNNINKYLPLFELIPFSSYIVIPALAFFKKLIKFRKIVSIKKDNLNFIIENDYLTFYHKRPGMQYLDKIKINNCNSVVCNNIHLSHRLLENIFKSCNLVKHKTELKLFLHDKYLQSVYYNYPVSFQIQQKNWKLKTIINYRKNYE